MGWVEDGKIRTEEVYRFPNGNVKKDGSLVWDVDALFREIKNGMKKCAELGKVPASMGIDTWAVDYVLLDGEGKRLGDCMAYRDSRTAGMDLKTYENISEEELYHRTGIQKVSFNTIFQYMADKEAGRFDGAESMLMVPDYLHYLLTGVKKQEYTNATTTALVDPATGKWDLDLIKRLGYPEKLFGELSMPGTTVGELSEEVAKEVGFSTTVVLPATHDTASAVMSVPTESDSAIYISSGTWSLMGLELLTANVGEKARLANFTNEGGYDHRFRFLKNIMGLWMIQSLKKELEAATGGEFSFAKLCDLAEEAEIDTLVDAADERFLSPESMTEEVKKASEEAGGKVPSAPGELARVIYRSLALCYEKTAKELEEVTGIISDRIHIVGGGSNADYLNRLTAEFTGKKVYAGPGEATAIGNLGAQMMAGGEFDGLAEFRKAVAESFEIKEY